MRHELIEKNIGLMVLLVIVAVSFGGLAEIVPLFGERSVQEPIEGLAPLPALELEGRDIYIREGCVGCHSQMVRPLRSETERYGHYSLSGEVAYEHPFLWGSKRTGPDLARVGGRYSDDWHHEHLINPRTLVPESNMPGYPWLADRVIDPQSVEKKLIALRTLGHPYSDEDIAGAANAVRDKTEMEALIAYLQGRGTNIKTRR